MNMKLLILAFLFVIVFLFIDLIIDLNRFVVVSYDIETTKNIKPFSFVLLSDLHNKQYGNNNQRLLNKIEEYHPDAILIAGDMITARKDVNMKKTLDFLADLSHKYPIFYGQGNHEYRLELYPEVYGAMISEFSELLSKTNINLLKNKKVELNENGISIFGLSIERKYYKRFKKTPMNGAYIDSVLGKPNQCEFNILIAHNPDYFKEYEDWGADLVLSGHVHGGLVRIPFVGGVISPSFKLFPKYDGGLFLGKYSKMILSRGLGTHTFPIRIFNPGELIFVTVNKKE